MSDFFEFEMEGEALEEQDSGVWLSIGDLMSGLLMFFALLFVTTQLQLNQLNQELKAKIAELERYEKAFQELPLVVLAAIQEKMGGTNLSVDPKTGDISIPNAILFDEGSAELKPAGKLFLLQFIPVYSEVIFSNSNFEKMITRVIIEGHTSSFGLDAENMQLSLQRAFSVQNYISSLNFTTQAKFKYKVVAAGRGELDANQKIDAPNDRKVVFRFQLQRPDTSTLFEKLTSKP